MHPGASLAHVGPIRMTLPGILNRSLALLAAVAALTTALSAAPAITGSAADGGQGPVTKKTGISGRTNERLNKFQVAAGSVMQARLRTPLDSSTARVDDQVDAVLTGPVSQDGTELIPAGSALLGKVLNVVAASPRQPLGRIEVAFYIVEHAATRSRAAIETQAVLFQAFPIEESGQARRTKPRPLDVRSSPDEMLSVRLAEPLIVYIPR